MDRIASDWSRSTLFQSNILISIKDEIDFIHNSKMIFSILATLASLSVIAIRADEISVAEDKCASLTADQVNKASKDKCDEITATCLNSFNTKGIKIKCWSKVKLATLQSLTQKTAIEILESDISELPRSSDFLKNACIKAENKIPSSFIKATAEKPELGKIVFAALEQDPSSLKNFFVDDSVKSFNLEICALINKSVISTITDKNTFKHIKANCLGKIDSVAFEGFSDELWENLNPAALSAVTKIQLSKLSSASVQKTTKEQVENLGPVPYSGWFKRIDSNHPCFATKDWNLNSKDAATALKERCGKAWTLGNSSISGRNESTVKILVSLALAWAIVFI